MPDKNIGDGIGPLSEANFNGLIYVVNDPDPDGAAVVGKTSYGATLPSLALFSGDKNGKKKIVTYCSLEQKSPVAGGAIEILVVVDTAKRITGGGNKNNQIYCKNPFINTTPDFDFSINPTLDVAASGSRRSIIDRGTFPAAVGTTIEFDCDEDWMINNGAGGSLMFWIISPTTGLSFKHHIEVAQLDR